MLTAAFGDGHNTAANNVVAALSSRGVANTGALDMLQRAQPHTMRFVSAAYRSVITRWPKIWQTLYRMADGLPLGDGALDFTPKITRATADLLRSTRPAALISTYPLYGHVIERLFGRGPLPFALLTVVTDSTSINRAWVNRADGHYAVADAASAEFLLEHGVDAERIHITGFPVHPQFASPPPTPVEKAVPSPPKVLYAPSTSSTEVRETLHAIRPVADRYGIRLTVVLGRHEARLRGFVSAEAPPGSEVIGWTDRMPSLLMDHHVLIGKAGGASVQEALAAGCPMLVNYVVPGQEEGNAALLESLGAGTTATSPTAVAETLSAMLDPAGRRWLEMRDAARRHGHPGAADAVAELALRLSADAAAQDK